MYDELLCKRKNIQFVEGLPESLTDEELLPLQKPDGSSQRELSGGKSFDEIYTPQKLEHYIFSTKSFFSR